MVKRATEIYAILATSRPGDNLHGTDTFLPGQGPSVVDVADEPVEGILSFISWHSGILTPLVRAHTGNAEEMEDLIRLGELVHQNPELPPRLEVVRYTMRRHVRWIER